MTASNLLDKSYKTLKEYFGKFSDTYSFNFEQPKIIPSDGSLIGEFWLNTKTSIGVFRGKYLLTEKDETAYIKFPAKEKQDIYYFQKTKNDILSSDTGYITMKFEEFVNLLSTPKLLVE